MDLVQDLLDDVRLSDGRYGSLAVIQTHISLMSAFGRIADIPKPKTPSQITPTGGYMVTVLSQTVCASCRPKRTPASVKYRPFMYKLGLRSKLRQIGAL